MFLAPDADVVIDVDTYERLARDALVSGEAGRCADASALYDDLLPAARYEEWAIAPRDRLRELQLELLRTAELWEQVLTLDPLDEVAHRGLMRRYADTATGWRRGSSSSICASCSRGSLVWSLIPRRCRSVGFSTWRRCRRLSWCRQASGTSALERSASPTKSSVRPRSTC